jgi:adenosine deaminase
MKKLVLTAVLIARTLAAQTQVEQRFRAIRDSPPELYAFLLRMPKGGDLHIHLAGAVYAENLVAAGAEHNLCVDQRKFALVNGGSACEVPADQAEKNNELYGALVDSLSMRNFIPTAKESGHDHFFAAFDKFLAADNLNTVKGIAEVVRRAAEQNESYLELMALWGGAPVSVLGKQTGLSDSFEETAGKLKNAGIADVVAGLKAHLEEADQGRRKLLQCDDKPDSNPCKVTVRYVYQVLREFPKEQVFAQVLAGFMLASSDPLVVGINFVQPEDGLNSMRDYHLHMQMVDFMRKQYPKVHITLHAGELALGLVPPEDLRFHIREAVEIGHAERIGHGVDVMYETGAAELLREMQRKHIAVEINLSSNAEILGVTGKDHPFPVYRKYGVPVVLSTDDEGVGRTHLTEEYLRAVQTYNLSYADIKQIARNSIKFSFLEESDKARVQADLEKRFRAFEAER